MCTAFKPVFIFSILFGFFVVTGEASAQGFPQQVSSMSNGGCVWENPPVIPENAFSNEDDLAKALSSNDSQEVDRALFALFQARELKLRTSPEFRLKEISPFLNDSKPLKRCVAVVILSSRFGGPVSPDAYANLLADPDLQVRIATVTALAESRVQLTPSIEEKLRNTLKEARTKPDTKSCLLSQAAVLLAVKGTTEEMRELGIEAYISQLNAFSESGVDQAIQRSRCITNKFIPFKNDPRLKVFEVPIRDLLGKKIPTFARAGIVMELEYLPSLESETLTAICQQLQFGDPVVSMMVQRALAKAKLDSTACVQAPGVVEALGSRNEIGVSGDLFSPIPFKFTERKGKRVNGEARPSNLKVLYAQNKKLKVWYQCPDGFPRSYVSWQCSECEVRGAAGAGQMSLANTDGYIMPVSDGNKYSLTINCNTSGFSGGGQGVIVEVEIPS